MRYALFLFLAPVMVACGGGEISAEEEEHVSLPVGFIGTWANSFTDCSLTAGANDAAPIALTQTTMVGHENECTFVGLETNGAGDEILVQMSCMGEGVSYQRTADMRLKGDTLLVSYEGGGAVTWTRCPTYPLTE